MNFYRTGALIILLAGMAGAPSAFSQYVPGGPKLRGTITSPDGRPLEGVTVSIRGAGKTFVTSVFTNLQGVYVFPAVEKGIKYSLWAQAQGFKTARLNVDAGNGEVEQVAGLQLQPLANLEKQLTGVEWMNGFPERTPAESREKRVYAANCSGCHANQFTLQNRFDADGWRKIVNVMSLSSNGTPIRPNASVTPTIDTYTDEIVRFLTKVRGPSPASYELKPLPRPTGEAARVVITEYDLPRPEAPPKPMSITAAIEWKGPRRAGKVARRMMPRSVLTVASFSPTRRRWTRAYSSSILRLATSPPTGFPPRTAASHRRTGS